MYAWPNRILSIGYAVVGSFAVFCHPIQGYDWCYQQPSAHFQ